MKKIISLVVIAIVTFSSHVVSAEYRFSDVNDSSKYGSAIDFLASEGIISGYLDGSYRPNALLNRVEFLKIVMGAKYGNSISPSFSYDSCFKDILPGQWYTGYVCFAQYKGIVSGYPDGTFGTERNINLAEALKITIKTFQYEISASEPWYKNIAIKASELNILPPDVGSMDHLLNRGQMADIITRIIKGERKELTEYVKKSGGNKVSYNEFSNALYVMQNENYEKEENTKSTTSQSSSLTTYKPSDLKAIWNIDVNTSSRKEVKCTPGIQMVEEEVKFNNYDQNYKQYSQWLSGINLKIFMPSHITENSPEIKGGIELARVWLLKAQEYLGPYPCSEVGIISFATSAGSLPGAITIGGNAGVDNYHLLWHELTHGYFGSHSASAQWLREGPSTALPNLIAADILTSGTYIDTKNLESKPYLDGDAAKSILENYMTPGHSGYTEGQIYRDKKVCEIPKDDYGNNSYWGRLLIIDLAVKYEDKTVMNALRAVYEKYRYTNLTPITSKDFFDAFLYYTPEKQREGAKNFLKERLCL